MELRGRVPIGAAGNVEGTQIASIGADIDENVVKATPVQRHEAGRDLRPCPPLARCDRLRDNQILLEH